MPKELHSLEEFQKQIPKGLELRVVRKSEFVKLKLRTPSYLFTYQTNSDEAADILKNAKDLEIVEISGPAEKKDEKTKQKAETN